MTTTNEMVDAGSNPNIPSNVAAAVYAIMQATLVPDGPTVWAMMTSQPDYEANYRALEGAGIALTNDYLGARGTDLRDKVAVFFNSKRIGLGLLRGHPTLGPGTLSKTLKGLPGVKPTLRYLDGKNTAGMLVSLETWLDACDLGAEQVANAGGTAPA